MHIYFSGIGGAGIGPLALIAHQAGYQVSGSDKQESDYIKSLKPSGITGIFIGQDETTIARVHKQTPIDWLVYSSAVAIENPNHPELVFARENNIKSSKRDDLTNKIIQDKNLKLIAIAGTHGKTTTTAMVIWLLKQLGVPVSYSVGAKLSFGEMGEYDPKSQYFVYECDEYDRNFLAFNPFLSLITGIAYDHHDIYPTESDYNQAFDQFISQSAQTIIWQNDAPKLALPQQTSKQITILERPTTKYTLPGEVNRLDAHLANTGVEIILKDIDLPNLDFSLINQFPGVSRRFEKIANNVYSDYAHTPEKVAGCLEMANELSKRVVVVYEPLTNKRQHFIKDTYKDLFKDVKKLYWVPSYLTREDPNQHILTPDELIDEMDNKTIAEPAELNENLKSAIIKHSAQGDLVVCISGGGGKSLDQWLRQEFAKD